MGTLIYHEKQEAALCGVHCLNTLLQGPLYSAVELSQIAQELDALEQKFMAESGMESEDYIKFIAEDSGNVSTDGFFSIQVLSKALEVFGLSCTNVDSPACIESAARPEQEEAFICNLREHWFALRKIDGDWWNLNSLLRAPQPLSQFYLSAYLDTLREQGYSIFVVQGQFPASVQDHMSAAGEGPGRWYTPEEAKTESKFSADARNSGYLKAAAHGALSHATEDGRMVTLKRRTSREQSRSRSQSWEASGDDDLARAIAASLQGHPAEPDAYVSATGNPHSISKGHTDEPSSVSVTQAPADFDPEPNAGPGVIELAIRLPHGERLLRRFHSSDPVSLVVHYLQWKFPEPRRSAVLSTQLPRRTLSDGHQKLRDANISNRETLVVEWKSL